VTVTKPIIVSLLFEKQKIKTIFHQHLTSGFVADTKTKPDGHMSPPKAFICFTKNAQAAELLQDSAQRKRGGAKLVSTMKNFQQ
jgi:hypothetical protein